MTTQAQLYPSLKRKAPLLPSGWHSTELCSISESKYPISREECLKLEFKGIDGGINLLLPISKESILVLNHIAGIVGITAEKYRLSDLVGATLLIQIKYNKVVKIKKHEK